MSRLRHNYNHVAQQSHHEVMCSYFECRFDRCLATFVDCDWRRSEPVPPYCCPEITTNKWTQQQGSWGDVHDVTVGTGVGLTLIAVLMHSASYVSRLQSRHSMRAWWLRAQLFFSSVWRSRSNMSRNRSRTDIRCECDFRMRTRTNASCMDTKRTTYRDENSDETGSLKK